MKGKLFVISAPSGAGKTTLIRKVLDRFDTLSYSISHTTRPPRQGEENGRDYFFVAPAEFKTLAEAGQMLEWAQVHGNYYGTSKAFVMAALDRGQSILLDIDVQGAAQVMASGLPMVSIFIMPPSVEELARRLSARATDTEAVIRTRLENAAREMDQRSDYDHVVVNDDLATAARELESIFAKEMDLC